MNLIINTDGASRGNPGPASYGFVIKKDGAEILHQEGVAIGVATNNIAEYSAVLRAFEYVRDHYAHKGPHTIHLLADSLLVIQQLSGRFKIKNPGLLEIFHQIKAMEMELGEIYYKHVPREQNFIADRMANKALDEQSSSRKNGLTSKK